MEPEKQLAKTNGFTRLPVATVIMAGVLASALLSFLLWRSRLADDLNAKIAAIKAAGLPVNRKDLAKWPMPVPDDENAAFIYTNAIAQLDTNSIEALSFEDAELRQPIPETMRSQFERVVKKNSLALNIISQITNAGESRYPINFSFDPTEDDQHLEGLRNLTRVLECDAILKAVNSNAPAASEDISSMLEVSQSLDNEPILISQFVSTAILGTACDTFQAVLCHTPVPDAELSKLEPQFAAAEATNRFLIALIGERANGNEFFYLAQNDPDKLMPSAGGPGSGGGGGSSSPNFGVAWRILGILERDRDFYLDAMATNILLIAQGPPASLALEAQDDRFGDAGESHILSTMFLPMMGSAAKRDASNRARLRDAIAAIAVERWRSAHHGALPGSLTNLTPAYLPAIPADPYDGKPLRYKELTNGYCIYSIGPNLRDDGGKEMPPLKIRETTPGWTNYDIVFTVQR